MTKSNFRVYAILYSMMLLHLVNPQIGGLKKIFNCILNIKPSCSILVALTPLQWLNLILGFMLHLVNPQIWGLKTDIQLQLEYPV